MADPAHIAAHDPDDEIRRQIIEAGKFRTARLLHQPSRSNPSQRRSPVAKATQAYQKRTPCAPTAGRPWIWRLRNS